MSAPIRRGYLACSVIVPGTAATLQSLIETKLGLTAGSLASIYREMTLQVDPETSSALSVRVGNANVGTTVGGVVQKGCTLAGQSITVGAGAVTNCVYLGMIYVQAVSGSPVLNIQLWEI